MVIHCTVSLHSIQDCKNNKRQISVVMHSTVSLHSIQACEVMLMKDSIANLHFI